MRPQTRAQAALRSYAGAPHRLSTSPSQAWPMRSKAFSWSAKVTAGQRASCGWRAASPAQS
eukprot:2732328-Lingulodinium_polyedra.AAC.1